MTSYPDQMKKSGLSYQLSATDLVGHLNCHHLTELDRLVADGLLPKPRVWDPLLQLLAERGSRHERAYIEHLQSSGLRVRRIEGVEVTEIRLGVGERLGRDDTETGPPVGEEPDHRRSIRRKRWKSSCEPPASRRRRLWMTKRSDRPTKILRRTRSRDPSRAPRACFIGPARTPFRAPRAR